MKLVDDEFDRLRGRMKAARQRRYDQHRHVRLYCARGADLPQAKLTDVSASSILSRYRPYSRTDGANALAREHGVHVNTILKLTSRESWAHLTGGSMSFGLGTQDENSTQRGSGGDTAMRYLDHASGILTGGKWVSVLDRMPEVGMPVHVRGPTLPGGRPTLAKLAGGPCGLEWKSLEWRGTAPCTHWFELEEAP